MKIVICHLPTERGLRRVRLVSTAIKTRQARRAPLFFGRPDPHADPCLITATPNAEPPPPRRAAGGGVEHQRARAQKQVAPAPAQG
eukprot:1748339-Prymnesium_polylepis.2